MTKPDVRQLIESLSQNRQLSEPQLLAALAPLVSYIAQTGIGADACLAASCLPLPVHYYSPVPDLDDLHNRQAWQRRSNLPGIRWNPKQQLDLLRHLGKQYGAECNWPPASDGDPYRFFTENNSFSFGCAAATHCLIRHCKPRRIVEIGSGYSSLVINATLKSNAARTAPAEYTIIDPYPQDFIGSGLTQLTLLKQQRVELIKPQFFRQLDRDDVLFIDSGHTVRIGSDVNFLILEVLPLLRPGVLVHFHDIPMPYEYAEVYFTNPAFRMLWTESYLLQAFLCFNEQFEILLAMSYLMQEQTEQFRTAFPHYNPALHLAGSGSFWIRRT